MAQEIEIKLTLPVRLAPRLRQLPLLAGMASRKRCLRNIYLDTPEQTLRQRRMALRRRQAGDFWLLTIKTEGEETRAGFSRRQEWEYPMPPDELAFAAVDDDTLRQQLQQLAPRLQPAFRTDFIRQCWQLQYGDSHIELALDLGRICARRHREMIREVELELLDGAEADLHALADTLQNILPGLAPHAPSKAARGYALLDGAISKASATN
ncbi:MAG: CYTH domain-containing protein [Zoogloeaceae bacterium]|jgi:inorganic triphosphatase YgiF|nr:CYTH domain-containing protein [Zoogloeaceae bacterium]